MLASRKQLKPDQFVFSPLRSGGLELLFGQIKTFNVELDVPEGASRALTMQDLLTWMRVNLLRERPELFLAEGDNL